MTKAMSKYTETLAEYLEDHDLPEDFDDIDGFADIFVAHYGDHEIGFESESTFESKLAGVAALWCPVFSSRISELELAISQTQTPTKTNTRTLEAGARKSQTWDTPVNPYASDPTNGITPQNIGTEDTYTDTDTNVATGYTPDEANARVQFFERNIINLKAELLKKFTNLFYKVY